MSRQIKRNLRRAPVRIKGMEGKGVGMKKGVTLLELIIVVILVSILVAVALPAYMKSRAKAEDNEMWGNLRVIRAAMLSYRMDTGLWSAGADATAINTNLKLRLPASANRTWDYQTKNTGVVCAQHRTSASRKWFINIATGGEEPVAGNCP